MNLGTIDRFLDRITMYRLALYYLLLLLGAAMLFGALGIMPFSPLAIAGSAAYMTAVCVITNFVFAYVYETPTNFESSLVTALILSLIITPPASPESFIFLTAASGLAISSKYILAIRKKHIFNPAAIAVALTAFGAGQTASWWVGSSKLMPLVFLGGILLVRKIGRGQMVLSFLGAVFVSTIVSAVLSGGGVVVGLQKTVIESSLFFLAFMMLTEPMTSPTTVKKQRWYGILAGLLFPPQIHLGSLYSTPELVLVVSNAFSYIISPKVKLLPKLKSAVALAPGIKDFVFASPRGFVYEPGQYMEWTLPHHGADSRGTRRYFTLASSPTEKNIRLGVKFYDKGSTYKEAMLQLKADTPIAAAQLGGDFVLPKDKTKKLVFIAGGIGITPFRSMIKYLVDTKDSRTLTIIYAEKNASAVVYKDVLEAAARQLSSKIVYILSSQAPPVNWAHSGSITAEMVKAEIPDYGERIYYISGPHSMVDAMKDLLRSIGVKEHDIKVDFFPGYA